MDKPIINSFSTIAPLIVQQYESYLPTAYSDELTLLQKVNMIIQKLAEIGQVTNDVITQWNTVMKWVMEDGLSIAVNEKLDTMATDGTLAHLLNDVALKQIKAGRINIEEYSNLCPKDVDGNVTNWDLALKEAHDLLPNGGEIIIPLGRFPFTLFQITNKFITVTGSGTLVNGTILIGEDVQKITYDRLHTRIAINMERDTFSDTVNAIELQRAYWIDIENCYFKNYNAGVYVRPLELGGSEQVHSIRVVIDGCTGERINYLLRIPKNLSGGVMGAGDFTVVNCNPVIFIKSAISAEGLDGLLCTNNNFTNTAADLIYDAPPEDVPKKDKIIHINKGAQIIISNNHIFEAGKEGIHLEGCQFFTISGNNIVWAGQYHIADGIRVSGGDPSGAEYSIGTITGNSIIMPTRSGISIEDNCGHISIQGNIVRSAGDLSFYHGAEDPSLFSPKGIFCGTNTTDIVTGVNSLSGSNAEVDNQSVYEGSSSVVNQMLNIKGLYTTSIIQTGGLSYSGDGTRKILFGVGSPESIVSAGAGSIFLNASGGEGLTLFIKTSDNVGGDDKKGWLPTNFTRADFNANSFQWASDSNHKIFWGSGDPEGNQTASQGSIFLRTDGTNGQTMYVKESGSGNIGWSPK